MIDVKNLSKRYRETLAVRDVSFSVEGEQVLGFLGPNGAGKTTIMKVLTGYHYPTQGEAFINGISVQADPVAVKAQIGYLPEMAPLYGELTVDEYLNFLADTRALPRTSRRPAISRAIEACALGEMRGRRIETLSKGFRQRTGLAGAIMHDPPILILDEPTTGLDPNQIIEIRELIKTLGKSKTVILSTHILQEVEAICSQVLILNEGRIAAKGSPEEIARSMKGGLKWQLVLKPVAEGASDGNVELREASRSAPHTALHDALGVFVKEAAARGWNVDQSSVGSSGKAARGLLDISFFAGVSGADEAPFAESIFDWAVRFNMKILGMSKERLTLEDIFVKLTKEGESLDSLREQGKKNIATRRRARKNGA